MQFQRDAYSLAIDPGADSLTLSAKGDRQPFLSLTWPLLLAPQFAAAPDARPGPATLETLPDGGIRVSAPLPAPIGGTLTNTLYLRPDRIVVTASYRADTDHAVAHWLIAPAGSRVGAADLHAYNGKPKNPTNGRIFDPADADISTAGHNYGYAIAGPRVILRRGGVSLCLGGTSLANDFGLNLRLIDSVVEHFRFNYGGDKPTHLPALTTHHGPRLQLLVTAEPDTDAVHGQFVQAMEADGIITFNRYGPEQDVWRRPVYCTWGDQLVKGRTFEAGKDWRGQKRTNVLLDEAFVRRCAQAIVDHDLNIGTFVIDAGWQDYRGDWNPDTKKFPNMRALVDDLHAMGFKVCFWYAPLQVEEAAPIRHVPGMVCPPNRHKDYFLDYENPAVRAHTARILHRFFSSGPDGWDVDGLKLDWMVERVYAQDPPHDLNWRGEERVITGIYRMVYEIARQHKPSIATWGGAGENPHLAPYSTMRSMEERFDSDLDYIAMHARLLDATRPGTMIKNHLSYDAENTAESIHRIRAVGGIPEIGLVLPEHVPADTMARIKAALL